MQNYFGAFYFDEFTHQWEEFKVHLLAVADFENLHATWALIAANVAFYQHDSSTVGFWSPA